MRSTGLFALIVLALAGCSSTAARHHVHHDTVNEHPESAVATGPSPRLGVAQFQVATADGRKIFLLCDECPPPSRKTPRRQENAQDKPAVSAKTRITPPPRTGRTMILEATRQRAWLVVNFDFDSDALPPDFSSRMRRVFSNVKADRYLISITGYTDNIGPQAYNDRLALRRAMAVRRGLLALGIPGITSDGISAQGKGLCCYIANNDTPENRHANRRAEIKIRVPDSTSPSPSISSTPQEEQ